MNLRKLFLGSAALLIATTIANGQVVIGNKETPHAGAILHLESNGSNGLILPRVSISDLSQWGLDGTSVDGMVIYNTAPGKEGIYARVNGKWVGQKTTSVESVTGISLSANKKIAPEAGVAFVPGETIVFQASVLPATAANKAVVWGSSNSEIASVDVNGNVTVNRAGGLVTITATAADGSGIHTSKTFRVAAKLKAGSGANDYVVIMAHNLGADETADPLVQSKALNGNYYQWGRAEAIATVDTPEGIISGFQNSPSQNLREPNLLNANTDPDSWNHINTAIKAGPDPCPEGWRLPTFIEWAGIVNNNTCAFIGTKGSAANNFSYGLKIGTDLYLPAAGMRHCGDPFTPDSERGSLVERGEFCNYWTSYEINPGWNGTLLRQTELGNPENLVPNTYKSQGVSVRCVKTQL